MEFSIAVLLHNVRSAHNVGSIFRTADAAGISRVYLTGYTPTPFDRFGRVQKDIAKTALGAETSLHWQYAKNPEGVLASLPRGGGGDLLSIVQTQEADSIYIWQRSAGALTKSARKMRRFA